MSDDNKPELQDIPQPKPLTEEKGLKPATSPPPMPNVNPPKPE
jgi:hypothetical protein